MYRHYIVFIVHLEEHQLAVITFLVKEALLFTIIIHFIAKMVVLCRKIFRTVYKTFSIADPVAKENLD